MELRQLRYFVAVAEELHFRKAAEGLHVAQPAVSEQIRKLEEELGVTLFNRTPRNVALTAAGAALREQARHVLRHADVARHAARNARDQEMMRLRIGYLSDSLPASIPRVLRHLAASSPSVHIDLQTGPALRLSEEVRAGRLDATVTSLPGPTNGLRVTPLGDQRPVVVLPATHPQAIQPTVRLDRLAPDRLVVLPRDTNPAFHDAIMALCHRAGVSPALVDVAEPRVEHVLLAVAAGAGLALLPESVTDRFASPGVRFVALEGARAAFRSAVLTHPHADSVATRALLRTLERLEGHGVVSGPRASAELAA
jgi:DNA-binding transcriptional LysR family regulator